MTKEQLLQLKNTQVSPMERVDISNIRIDPAMPAALRMEEYLHQIKNPYAFKCGEISVNICFCSNGKPLQDVLASYFIALKKHQ